MKKYKVISLGLALTLIIQAIPATRLWAAPASNSEWEAAQEGNQMAAVISGVADIDGDAETEEIIYETIEINTAEDFIAFAKNCHLDAWSANKIVLLKQDINLADTSFETVPVFAGTFDGEGHTISGFRPKEQGYIVGLFRHIQNGGIVRNLTLKSTVNAVNEKQYIGSICGMNYGTIKNCAFEGTVSGQNTVGGIAAINEATGNITGCKVNGRITGYYSTGGIVGTNHGIITFCNNYCGINDDSDWVEEDDEMGTGLFFSFQTTEDNVEIYSGVDTGGIAGYSNGLIERCNNYGKVGYEHTGYNIGGIAGRQAGVVLLCTNNGEVYGRKDVGGIVGQMEPDIEVDEAQSLRNAVNKLHDLIDKTLDDMQGGKNAVKADLDNLNMYGDGALDYGNAMADEMSDFVNENLNQVQSLTERVEHIIDMLPDISEDVTKSLDAFARFNNMIKQLMKDLEVLSKLEGNYNETDYNRVALLSTVGGKLSCSSSNPAKGDTVTVTVSPDSGYELEGSLSIVDTKNAAVSYTRDSQNADGSGKYTFTMPSENVKVTAYFRHKDTNSTFAAYVALTDQPDITTAENTSDANDNVSGEHAADSQTNSSEADREKDSENTSTSETDQGIEGNSDQNTDNSAEDGSGNNNGDNIVDNSNNNGGNNATDGADNSGENNAADGTDNNGGNNATDDSSNGGENNPTDDSDNGSGNNTTDGSDQNAGDSTEGSEQGDNKDSTDIEIRLHSNLSGSASYVKIDNTVTLTVRPDSAYTLSSIPTATDAGGKSLSVTQTQNGSYQYKFDVTNAASPVSVEISFKKQNKESSVNTSFDNLEAAIKELQESSEAVKESLQRINDIMNGRAWKDLSSSEKDDIINEIVNMADDLGRMATSAATVLSELSSIYNILSPNIEDAAKAAKKDIEKATDEIHSMITSLKDALKGVKGIINYMNIQPDINFSPLDPAFDANREDLHGQLSGILDSLKSLSGNASNFSDLVNADLKAVNDQLNVVFNLLADHFTNATELSLEELYEEADEEDLASIITGRTDSCVNNGIVKGDINIGGIAGSMSIDEEDPEDNAAGSIDYQIGRRFITKCIISDSTNNGYITAKKDGAGGIVGYMKHGIVTNSESYGNIESTEGDYVGGIAGESLTIIQNCYSLCSVYGGKNVGGIAGYGNTIHDCYAIVFVDASVGRRGAIAGQATADGFVTGNYYVGDDIYGIDNISYSGIAEPISYSELLTVEQLPTAFWHLKVTYRIEDTWLGTEEVKYGESLANLNFPEIPAKEGAYGVWPDYSDQVMTGNLLIEGSYIDTVTVVESSEKAESEQNLWKKPYALVEQAFTEDTVLNVSLGNQTPPEEASDKDYVIYDISLENSGIKDSETFSIRLLNPFGEKAQVWGYLDGVWTKLEGKTRGQYLQVEMNGSKEVFCIAGNSSNILLPIAVGAAAVIVILLIFVAKQIKKKHKDRPVEAED